MTGFELIIDFILSFTQIEIDVEFSGFHFYYHGHLILVTPPQGYLRFNKEMALEAHWLNPDSPNINSKKLGPSTLLWKHQLDESVLGLFFKKTSTASFWINEPLIQTLAESPLILSEEKLHKKNVKA
ncbi:hypothetical protein HMI54_010680 [Coelomomyces lativittatus]|nr:hypothetical protein HMI54_010680 [Coelomomyces lativittatus]KAJ1507055.1 hypothetical protein HMI55_000928 [Coelomomyces lativittatus]